MRGIPASRAKGRTEDRDGERRTPRSSRWSRSAGVVVLVLAGMVVAGTPAPVWASGDVNQKACSNEAMNGFSTSLPDCRAYELVSTPYKDGYPLARTGEIALNGERMLLQSLGSVAGIEGGNGLEGSVYESVRTDHSGWSVRAINPPASVYPYMAFQDRSPDLESTLWNGRTASQSADAANLFVRKPDGSIASVGPMLPPAAASTPPGGDQPPRAEADSLLKYRGASADLSHVFFIIRPNEEFSSAVSSAWKGDTTLVGPEIFSLYEYSGLNNTEPKLVGVLNKGRLKSDTEAVMITQCGTELGFGAGGAPSGSVYNAISETGNTVFFTAYPGGCENEVGEIGAGPPVREVYARVSESETVHISEPSHGDCEECNTSSPAEASFAGASHDGSKVFFMSAQAGLLPGAAGMNLYEYDFNAPNKGHKLIRVSAVTSSPASEPKVVGMVRVSEDGSRVYFVATGKPLVNNKNESGTDAAEGADNLYVYDTVTGSTTFIAQLSPADGGDWQNLDRHPAQATPNGEVLIFASSALLTSDDHSSVVQLFEYDAATSELVRVSVGQHKEPGEPGGYFCPITKAVEEGYNCDGNTENTNLAPLLLPPQYQTIDYGNLRTEGGSSLEISSTGTTAIFSSRDALAPQATNSLSGEEPCRDVYEYRWNNDGTPGALHKGNVLLVSDGQDLGKANSSLVVGGECGSGDENTMDESGKDILVESSRQLVSQDTNSQVDTYDAREGGGFPSVVSRPDCAQDGCQGSLGVSPSLLVAGSVSQAGGGNLALPPASQSVVRRKPASLTRAQKLTRALSACRKERNKHKRAVCYSRARRRYGGKPMAKKGTVRASHGSSRGGSK